MRGSLLAAVSVVCAGCATTMPTTTVTRTPVSRIAYTSLPSPSAAIQGASGIALRASFLPGAPTSTRSDGALAFPLFQPELGALVKIGKSSFIGGRISLSSTSWGALTPATLITPGAESWAFDVSVGGGHDFRFTDLFGLSVSGELGLAGTSLDKLTGTRRSTELHTLPTGRITTGFLVTPGQFRLYAGGTVATSVTNDATGVLTETCQLDCTTSETGSVGMTLVAMVGAGVRWQAHELVSLGLEGWLPVSDLQRSPPVFSFTVRVGDFHTTPPAPKPLPPPPPPPEFTPDPQQAPVQL